MTPARVGRCQGCVGPGAASAHQRSPIWPCRHATKPLTLTGTKRGDANTAWHSCNGHCQPARTGRSVPVLTNSCAAQQRSAPLSVGVTRWAAGAAGVCRAWPATAPPAWCRRQAKYPARALRCAPGSTTGWNKLGHPPYAIRHPPSAIRHPLSAIRHPHTVHLATPHPARTHPPPRRQHKTRHAQICRQPVDVVHRAAVS